MLTKIVHRVLAIVFLMSLVSATAAAYSGALMVKMLDGVDSANGHEGQQYQAVVAKDSTIGGVLVPKGTQAFVLLIRGVAGSDWMLQLVRWCWTARSCWCMESRRT
jgi:hypothetical protein